VFVVEIAVPVTGLIAAYSGPLQPER